MIYATSLGNDEDSFINIGSRFAEERKSNQHGRGREQSANIKDIQKGNFQLMVLSGGGRGGGGRREGDLV